MSASPTALAMAPAGLTVLGQVRRRALRDRRLSAEIAWVTTQSDGPTLVSAERTAACLPVETLESVDTALADLAAAALVHGALAL